MGMDFYTVNCKYIDDYWHTRDRKPVYPGNQPASLKIVSNLMHRIFKFVIVFE